MSNIVKFQASAHRGCAFDACNLEGTFLCSDCLRRICQRHAATEWLCKSCADNEKYAHVSYETFYRLNRAQEIADQIAREDRERARRLRDERARLGYLTLVILAVTVFLAILLWMAL